MDGFRLNGTFRWARHHWPWVFGGALWLIAVGAGMGSLWTYALTAGPQPEPSAAWPIQSRLSRVSGRATLVMFAHPLCPCTRTSLEELGLIAARTQGRLTAHVVFSGVAQTLGVPGSSLRDLAASIPGVRVFVDPEGREAGAFGVVTSGHTMLYDAGGRMLFTGGITAARGHAGDNPGRSAVVNLVNGAPGVVRRRTSVFGCIMLDRPVRG